MMHTFTPRFWFALGLVVVGVTLRVIPHPWDFAPIGAIALFGGARFERRAFAILVPLLAMVVSDAMIGFHSLMPVIYATYALIAMVGMLLRDRDNIVAIGGCALLSSAIFFVIVNFAVWATGTMYPKTAAGLVGCYVAAIPFFGNTVASDLLFTAIFFGAFGIAERRIPALAQVRCAVRAPQIPFRVCD